MSRRRTVSASLIALLALGAGIVWVCGGGQEGPWEPAREDLGPRRVPAPAALAAPQDGRRPVAAPAGPAADDAPADADAVQADPTPFRPSLRVETVDAATGAPVADRWNLGTGEVVGGPWPAGHEPTEAEIAAQAEGLRASRAAWEEAFLPSGAVRPEALSSLAFVSASRWGAAVRVTVRPPEGYVTWPEGVAWPESLAAGVREAYARVPLFREVPLDVEVLDPEGRPAEGAEIEALEIAGRLAPVVVEARGPGRLRVRGIPFLPGESLRAAVAWVPQARDGSAALTLPAPEEVVVMEGTPDPELVTTIPGRWDDPWRLRVRLRGPTPPLLRDRNEEDFDVVQEPPGPPSVDAGGTVRVRVVAWDGTPVGGANVFAMETDASGLAVLTDVPEGELRLRATAIGRLPATGTVFVRGGAEVEARLEEPLGAALDVWVTDADGRPLAGAEVTVRGGLVFDVVDGVQRLDGTTDAEGRRSFARVEPTTVAVVASWGARRRRTPVALEDGRRTFLHVVLE